MLRLGDGVWLCQQEHGAATALPGASTAAAPTVLLAQLAPAAAERVAGDADVWAVARDCCQAVVRLQRGGEIAKERARPHHRFATLGEHVDLW